MTQTPDMPLVERLDAALGEVARRIEQMTGLRDADAAANNGRAIDEAKSTDDILNDKPVNPLRHWRWE